MERKEPLRYTYANLHARVHAEMSVLLSSVLEISPRTFDI